MTKKMFVRKVRIYSHLLKLRVRLAVLFTQLMLRIKYLKLDELIGKTVTIHSIESVCTDIQRDLKMPADAIPSDIEEKNLRGMIAKYGLLDISYSIQHHDLREAFRGWDAIRMLNLYQNNLITEGDYEDGDFFGLDMGIAVYELLAEDFEAKQLYILIFLTTDHSKLSAQESIKRYFQYMQEFPADYFPRQFVVSDAAISNTKSAWINKHVYL